MQHEKIKQDEKLKIVKKYLCILMLFITSLIMLPSFANKPLPLDKAFQLSVSVINSQQINAQWKIAPGYYLYRKHMHFTFTPNMNADIRLPQGELKQDLNRGEYEVYSGNLIVPIFINSDIKKVELDIKYQGCSEHGFCYPPTNKILTLNIENKNNVGNENNVGNKNNIINKNNIGNEKTNLISANAQTNSWQSLLTDQNSVHALLNSQSLFVMLLIFGGLGLLLAFTPCVLPMIPILTSIIVGHNQPINSKKAFLLSSVYVLGSSVTYAAAGLFAAYMGGSLQAWLQQPWVIAIASGIFVILSLSLFGLYDLHLPRYWQNRITSISRKQVGGTYTGVFIMGVISTLIVSPCVTAPLVGVLMYIAHSGNLLLGSAALFVMGLGMGIPLIIIGTSAGKWLPRRGPWMNALQYLFGILMLVMALWLLSRVFSLKMIMIFAAVLLFSAAFYFGIHRAKSTNKILYHRGLGSASALLGVLLIAAINMPYFANQFAEKISHSSSSFIIVKNIEDVNQQLSLARISGKPVILDFYADWCESCVVMDKTVFSKSSIKNSLNQFVLLRADLSANNTEDERMLKNYDVIAPPTVLFFNNKGQEVNSRRIVGELNAQEFLNRINTFITASCDKDVAC